MQTHVTRPSPGLGIQNCWLKAKQESWCSMPRYLISDLSLVDTVTWFKKIQKSPSLFLQPLCYTVVIKHSHQLFVSEWFCCRESLHRVWTGGPSRWRTSKLMASLRSSDSGEAEWCLCPVPLCSPWWKRILNMILSQTANSRRNKHSLGKQQLLLDQFIYLKSSSQQSRSTANSDWSNTLPPQHRWLEQSLVVTL